MPSLLDTLKSVGMLSPLGQDFKSFANNLISDQEQNKFNQILSHAANMIEQNVQPTSYLDTTIPHVAPSKLSDLMPNSKEGQITLSGPTEYKSTETPGVTLPGEGAKGKTPIYSEMMPEEQNKKNLDQLANFMIKSSGLKSISPEQLKNSLLGLEQLVKANTPQQADYTFQHFPQNDTVVKINKNNPNDITVIQKGKPEQRLENVSNYVATQDYPDFGIKKGQQVRGGFQLDQNNNRTFVPLGKPGYKPSAPKTPSEKEQPYKGYSEDYGSIMSGANTIENFANQIQNAVPKSSSNLNLAGLKTIHVTLPNGQLKEMTPEQATAELQNLKSKYLRTNIAMAKRIGLWKGINRINLDIKKGGISPQIAIDAFMQNNPGLNEDYKDIIKNYFQLKGQ